MPHIELRKILRIGNSSLAITLPKTWLDFYGLKNGDTVELISNGNIKITPSKKEDRFNGTS